MAEEKSDEEEEHDWEFESDYDENKKIITITVKDNSTGKKYEKKYDKSNYSFIAMEYDKMVQVFNDETIDFRCEIEKVYGDVLVYFEEPGQQNPVLRYQFRLEEV